MNSYKAKVDNIYIYLNDSKEMDDYIEKGASIHMDDGTCIYSPGKGWMQDKPEFGPTKAKETFSPEILRAFLMEKEGLDG